MSFQPTASGCQKANRRTTTTNDRHWGHWRWLNCLPQHRYADAIRHWHNLFKVTPRGIVVHEGTIRLNLESLS